MSIRDNVEANHTNLNNPMRNGVFLEEEGMTNKVHQNQQMNSPHKMRTSNTKSPNR